MAKEEALSPLKELLPFSPEIVRNDQIVRNHVCVRTGGFSQHSKAFAGISNYSRSEVMNMYVDLDNLAIPHYL